MMQYTAAFDHFIDIFKLVCIKNVELLELNIAHLALMSLPCCVGQTVLTDVNRSDLRIFVAAGVNDLVSRSDQKDKYQRFP